MDQNFGWIEIVVFAGIALIFGVWQLLSINREIARDRAARTDRAAKASSSRPGHPEGQHELDDR